MQAAWRRVLRWMALPGALGLGSLAWAGLIEPRLLRWVDTEIELSSWLGPSLRVAVVSDLHVGSPHMDLPRLRHIVECVNARRVDLVVLTGDFVVFRIPGQKPVAIADIARELSRLDAGLGRYAVLGNHDRAVDPKGIMAAFGDHGIPVLEDVVHYLDWADGHFALVGLSDYGSGPRNYAAALAGLRAGVPAIAISHNPQVMKIVPDSIELTIAGHTHGGQVILPLHRWAGVGVKVPMRQRGLYRLGQRQLFVSSGVGMSNLPVRFGVLPRIDLLSIVSQGSSSTRPR